MCTLVLLLSEKRLVFIDVCSEFISNSCNAIEKSPHPFQRHAKKLVIQMTFQG